MGLVAHSALSAPGFYSYSFDSLQETQRSLVGNSWSQVWVPGPLRFSYLGSEVASSERLAVLGHMQALPKNVKGYLRSFSYTLVCLVVSVYVTVSRYLGIVEAPA